MIPKTHEKEILHLGKENYDLVKGDFTPEEASELVNDMFSKNINFHNLKSFIQLIRIGFKDHSTEQCIMELRLAQEKAKEMITEAKESGKSIRLNSTISIELI